MRVFRRLGCCAGVLTAIAAALTLSSGGVTAQAGAPPFPTIMTFERAQAFVQAAERKLDYVPGEVLVKFKAGVTASGQQRALDAVRSRPSVSQLRWVGEVALLRDQREQNATILAAQLSAQPEVEYAEPNYLRHVSRTPTDPGFSARQWNFTAIDLPSAWDINDGASSSIIVAVVDTGVTTVNQSFQARTWNGTAIQTIVVPFAVNPDLSPDRSRLVTPRDFVFTGTATVMDMVGHGTHVSSTIAEDTNNTLAEAGIAYNAKIMPVKVCFGFWEVQFSISGDGFRGFAPLDAGGCPDEAIAAGIRYAADNGANVINLSLGGPGASITVKDALTYALGKGAFIAVAAGNEFEEGNPVEYPAGFGPTMDGVMTVGAVGRSLRRSYFSNTGSHVEIAAPGGDFRDGGLNGLIWQATIAASDSDAETVLFPRFDRYQETPEQGTSMATPHVAGIAALIMSQGVTNPAAVEALIKKTARFLGTADPSTPNRNKEFGFGLIQPRVALRGFGIAK